MAQLRVFKYHSIYKPIPLGWKKVPVLEVRNPPDKHIVIESTGDRLYALHVEKYFSGVRQTANG